MSEFNGVRKETLANGLTVVLREMHHAPVATFWVWYRVGSRLERPPRTGLTHWVEHMLFRGTERFPGASVHKMVAREGGARNGFTSNDFTTYFETLPADRFDLALQLEADRMINARFTAEAVEAERTIILSERAGRENHAGYRLREKMLLAAYPNHGYGYPIIGFEDDLKRITRDELWAHYRTYYGPNNAIVVTAGDFDPDVLLARIEELFGPAGADALVQLTPDQRVEAPQAEQRRVHLSGPEPTTYVQVLFRAVEATHPDFFPLLVLDAILGGAKTMGFSGGGGNRTSRLYRALVETELAASAGSNIRPTVDPFALGIGATVRQGLDPQLVEDAIWAQVEQTRQDFVSEEEIARALKQTRAQFAYGTESVSNQGYWLGFSEIVASARWFLTFPDQLAAVSAADVRRVARQYLRPKAATVGWYVAE